MLRKSFKSPAHPLGGPLHTQHILETIMKNHDSWEMSRERQVVIVSGVRTPVGRYMGTLKDVPAYDLAALVLNEAVQRIGLDPGHVDEVVMGQSYQNGEYVNIARMALLTAGWPETIPGVTLDRRCCTGLEVVRIAATMIKAREADIVVAGGVESMSSAEFYLPGDVKWGLGGKRGMPRGHGDLAISGIPFYDRIQRARVMSQPIGRYGVLASMMAWAESAAQEYGITREDCDKWALRSHLRACEAIEQGRFVEETVPIFVSQGKNETISFCCDETPRKDAALEKLAALRPVIGGVCTAGNSSSENDGAAAVVIMSEGSARERGLEVLARPVSFGVAAVDPRRTYKAVPLAASKALERAGLTLDQIPLIEVQEAFASQVLADLIEMGLGPDDFDRVNVNGSGISLGHPIACTGVRVLVSLINEMRRRDVDCGLECICGGGGLGIAAVLERDRH